MRRRSRSRSKSRNIKGYRKLKSVSRRKSKSKSKSKSDKLYVELRTTKKENNLGQVISILKNKNGIKYDGDGFGKNEASIFFNVDKSQLNYVKQIAKKNKLKFRSNKILN